MKGHNVIAIFCVLAMCKVYSIKASTSKQDAVQRHKRLDNRRSERLIQTSTPVPVTTPYSPCDPYSPQKPDFSAPYRRIIEVKCYEHIWDLKTRIEKDKRFQDCRATHKKGGSHAVGGRDASKGEFPHMAAIGWVAKSGGWIFKCGGSLISPNVVLTAGHCTRASPLDTTIADTVPKIVRLGDKRIVQIKKYGPQPTDVNISTILPHPLYRPPKKYNDIALMQLEKNVEFTATIHPACLWPYFDTQKLGTKATVTGWGVVKSGDVKMAPILQAAVVDLIPSGQCDDLLGRFHNRHWCGLEDHQLCAGTLAGGADSCQGDSGGPLQVEIPIPKNTLGHIHYVIGVTSFGVQCGRPNAPGVYSRVSSYVDWIENVVWPEAFNRYSLSNT